MRIKTSYYQSVSEYLPNMCLPQHLIDDIVLECSLDTVKHSRSFLSAYAKNLSQLKNLFEAVRHGNLRCIRWLLKHSYHYSDQHAKVLMDEAARCGQLEVLQWLHDSVQFISVFWRWKIFDKI